LKATEQPIDTDTAAGKCLVDMLGVFAEFEMNPVSVFRSGRSRQFRQTSPPMMPQLVQTMRRRNAGTGMSADHWSTFITASWWQHSQ
jgi:hypothetical protein